MIYIYYSMNHRYLQKIQMRFITIVICSFFLFSCNQSEKIKKELTGKWVIAEAYRDDNPTDMLQNAYIQLEPNILKTNMFGSDIESKYSVSENNITLLDPPNTTFKIVEKSSGKLILTTEIEEFVFKIIIEKDQ